MGGDEERVAGLVGPGIQKMGPGREVGGREFEMSGGPGKKW